MKKLRLFDSLKFVVAVVVATFILNVAHAATLPAGYTELEYLESTGEQYVDTNATLNTDTDDVEIVFQAVSDDIVNVNMNLFGARQSTTEKTYTLGVYNGRWRFGWGNSSPSFGTANTNKHTARIEHNNGVLKIDNNVIATSGNASIVTPTTATLFAIHATATTAIYYGTFKIYSYKKWTNDTLVQNFIPARRDSDGVLGMYDLADANPATAFHTNAGTGEFVAGPATPIKIATTKYNEESFAPVKTDLSAAVNAVEYVVSNTMTQAQQIDQIATNKQTRPDEGCPAKYCLLVEDEDGTPHWYPIVGANGVEYVLPSGYTQLEYIESDGASYLIVPYRVNNKTVFYARYNEMQKGTNVASVIFGVTSTADVSKANYGILRLLNGTSNFNRMGWGDSTSGSVIDVNAPQNLNTWYEVLYDQNKLYQDNVLYATSATPNDTEWVANYDLGIFARNGATVTMPAIAKISSVWAKEDGVYKINLVPAKNSSGVVGMYDVVSGNFFTNTGTGVFGEGPVVE